MPKLFFAEAVLFDGDRSIRIVTTNKDLAIQKLKDAFVDSYGPISAYGYETWEEWEADSYVYAREIRLDHYWEEY